MWVTGLTGDIGAGKSTVASLFSDKGAVVVDADDIVRGLWRRPAFVEAARLRWGGEILDGEGRIQPSAVASRAFASEREYRWLCDLLHRPVFLEMERRLASLSGWVVAEVPLLFEVGPPFWVDETVYVTASASTRARRNAFRGLDGARLSARERFLLPSEEKRRRAHFVVDNDASLEVLARRAETLGRDFADLGGMGLFVSLGGGEGFADALAGGRLAVPLPSVSGQGLFLGLERHFPDVARLAEAFSVEVLLFDRPRRLSRGAARRALEYLDR
ncbi:dephospho-CoA kinase [Aminirod propionatiphilus]|uniref:Dephospho-CoA kinase n=1 Tax=Aminirod propionatiphilus TaxID=3415223 RepID=A0ACD1DYT1_9BACT|nr:dephospho-CoA kinase [Synergistota bacterium]